MQRITSRSEKVDRHENERDLAQSRQAYLRTVEAFGQYRSPDAVHRILVDNKAQGEILGELVDLLRPHIASRQGIDIRKKTPLGTTSTKLTGSAGLKRALNVRYLLRHLIGNWFKGAWREPTFLFSRLGRLIRREGYSAGVMRAIYDRDTKGYGFLDRIFLEYPLHRAVYDRLHILTRKTRPRWRSVCNKGEA